MAYRIRAGAYDVTARVGASRGDYCPLILRPCIQTLARARFSAKSHPALPCLAWRGVGSQSQLDSARSRIPHPRTLSFVLYTRVICTAPPSRWKRGIYSKTGVVMLFMLIMRRDAPLLPLARGPSTLSGPLRHQSPREEQPYPGSCCSSSKTVAIVKILLRSPVPS